MKKNKILAVCLVLALGVFLIYQNFQSRKEIPQQQTPTGEITSQDTQVAWPTQDINLIVPWAAGGVTDIAARGFAQALSQTSGKNVTVINVPGASGYTGTQQALAEKADGNTLIFSAETPATFRCLDTGDISYQEDLSVIQLMVSDAKVVVVDANSPYNTMEDLVNAIKENPNKITMSYTGPGASGHIQGLLYKMAGLQINDVPLGSGSAALTALFSGTVDFTNANLATVIDYIKDGKVKALAVFSDKETTGDWGTLEPITNALPDISPYMPFYFPNCIAVDKNVDAQTKQAILTACQTAVNSDYWQKFAKDNGYLTLTNVTMEKADAYWQEWQGIVSYLLYDNGAAPKNPADFGIERVVK